MKRILLLLLCGCLLLAACAAKTEGVTEPETLPDLPEPMPQTEPAPNDTDYAAALAAVFDDVEETPQTDFSYELQGETAILTAYRGTSEAVRVPGTLGGCPVTAIADGVFANLNLSVLILPETITDYGADILKNTALTALCAPFPTAGGYLGVLWGASTSVGNRLPALKSLRYYKVLAPAQTLCLPENALSGCTGLVALELPAGSALGASAFSGCEKLRYVNAETLSKVGEKAFDGCASLQSLRFGTGLTQIGFAALRDCRSLTELQLPFIGTSPEKQTGEPSERTNFLGYLFGATKPAFSKGFYPAFLKKITLLEGCAELPDFALYECASLTELSLPDTLQSVGGRALAGCTALCRLTLPQGCTEIGDAACAGCTALAEVQMPAGMKIGKNAFLGCPFAN